MLIYLTGIDGSGKSTITKKLQQEIIEGEVQTVWARYTPKIAKVLIAPFKKSFVKDPEKDFLMDSTEYDKWSGYKKKITRWPFLSRSFFLLQAFDYSVQLVKLRKVLKNHKQRTIIMDRYLLDFIVDQSVNYGDISDSIITKNYLRRLHRFDYVFFIDTKEEVAFGRKGDIPSVDYLKERRKIYVEYLSKLPNGYVIDNNSTLSETIHCIHNIINRYDKKNQTSFHA